MQGSICWAIATAATAGLAIGTVILRTVWERLKICETNHLATHRQLEQAETRLLILEAWKELHAQGPPRGTSPARD